MKARWRGLARSIRQACCQDDEHVKRAADLLAAERKRLAEILCQSFVGQDLGKVGETLEAACNALTREQHDKFVELRSAFQKVSGLHSEHGGDVKPHLCFEFADVDTISAVFAVARPFASCSIYFAHRGLILSACLSSTLCEASPRQP